MNPLVTDLLLPVLSALEAGGSSNVLARELDRVRSARLLSQDAEDTLTRIDAQLARGRRRESLLRVLLETTTDLVGITDFEAMLEAIVRRTRMLLGSDMAYISLNDYERDETYIHSTDGVATEAYRNIRMELGTGVLGKIAEGSGSAQVIDYFADPDITHVSDIDAAVRGEGVQSIMGAPLMRDGVLLGALLVAERYRRHYTDEEVWLVESMSALACVALSNARIIGDLKLALGERDALQERLEIEHQRIADAQLFERALVDSAVTANPYAEFLEHLQTWHAGNVWLLDEIGRIIEGSVEPPVSSARFEKILTRGHRSGEVERLELEDGTVYSLLAVSAATRVIGGIVVTGTVDDAAERLLRRAGVMLSVLRLMDEHSREQTVKAEASLVHALLRAEPKFEAITVQRAQRFGFRPGNPIHIHVIATDTRAELVIDALRAHPVLSGGAFAEANGYAVFIHHDVLGEHLVQLLADRDIRSTVGFERESAWHGSLADLHVRAEQTLRAMLALDLTGHAASHATLGPVGMLMSSASPTHVRAIIDIELGPLIEYDTRKGTRLVETLWAFFGADRHHVQAAKALHVHPNTLRQRLDRISELLGADWGSSRRSSMIYLALQLHRLRNTH